MPMPSNIEEFQVDSYRYKYVDGVTVSISRDGKSAAASSRVSENDAFLKALAQLNGEDVKEEDAEPTFLVSGDAVLTEDADVSPGSADVLVDADGDDADRGDSDGGSDDGERAASFDFTYGDAQVDAAPAV